MRRLAILGAALATLSPLACSSDKTTEPTISVPRTLSAVGTVPEAAAAGASLAEPLRIRVLDAKGEPVAGASVSWSVASGGGTLAEHSPTTNTSGEASVSWTLGTAAGENVARATVGDLDPVVFKVRGVAGVPATVALLSEGEAVVTLSFSAIGESRKLTAHVADKHGNKIDAPALGWSTSDMTIAKVDPSGLLTAVGEGETVLTVTSGGVSTTVPVRISAPAVWEIAFVRNMPNTAPYQVYIMRTDGAGVRSLTAGPHYHAAPAWSRDGSRIAVVETTYQRILTMDARGGGADTITVRSDRHYTPSWSPDGSRIVATRWNSPGDRIVAMNANGGEATFLTAGTGGSDSEPVWSPDGSKIAFTRNIDGNWGIHVMNADGTGVKRLASPFPQLCSRPAWSPDGSSLIAACTDDHIYLLHADGTTPAERLTAGQEQYMKPAWSPDGSQIAFVRYWQPGGVYQIYLMNFDGTGVRRISDGTANDLDPAWGPKLKP